MELISMPAIKEKDRFFKTSKAVRKLRESLEKATKKDFEKFARDRREAQQQSRKIIRG